MRIRRQPSTRAQFVAEVAEIGIVEPTFHVRAGVDAGRSVALKVNLIAAAGRIGASEEVVEADFVKSCGRGVSGDVSADAVVVLIGPDDHRHRVPANETLYA